MSQLFKNYKSDYLINLNKKALDFHLAEAEKRREVVKEGIQLRINTKKLFDERIEQLIEIYYPLIINLLEEKALQGKNIGYLNIEKDDFKFDFINNGYSRNLELMMRKLLKKYRLQLEGLQYQVWNNNGLILKLFW